MLSRIDAPVVVKPDAVSKKASVKGVIEFVNRKGREPKSDIINQPNETIAKPSLALISPFILVNLKTINPAKIVIKTEYKIPKDSLS